MILSRLLGIIGRKYNLWKFWRQHSNLFCNIQDIASNVVIDKGKGNRIIIGIGSSLNDCHISFWGNNCTLEIKENTNLRQVNFWFEDSNGIILIGSTTTIESGCQFASVEGTDIEIGSNCMLSHDVDIRTTDSHSIIDIDGNRINPSDNVIIGHHVWVGIRATILKGSIVADNSIIAACSVVTKKTVIKENSIVAGNPAKIVKSDVNWKRERI